MVARSATSATRARATKKSAVRDGVRREELVTAAARIFAAKGYGQTSIQDVADEIGVLKGSLYYYIDSKEDLLFEVIRSTLVTWHELVDTTKASTAPTLERIRTYVEHNIQGSLAERDRTTVFLHDFQALSPKRRQMIVNLRHEHDELLRELIQKAKDEGSVPADVDVKLVALGILTMCGSLYRWYDPRGNLSPDDIARDLSEFLMAGLLGFGSSKTGESR